MRVPSEKFGLAEPPATYRERLRMPSNDAWIIVTTAPNTRIQRRREPEAPRLRTPFVPAPGRGACTAAGWSCKDVAAFPRYLFAKITPDRWAEFFEQESQGVAGFVRMAKAGRRRCQMQSSPICSLARPTTRCRSRRAERDRSPSSPQRFSRR